LAFEKKKRQFRKVKNYDTIKKFIDKKFYENIPQAANNREMPLRDK